MSERNPVGWFELYVRDIKRAKAFYEKVLGVSLTLLKQSGGSLENMWAFPMNRDGRPDVSDSAWKLVRISRPIG